MTLFTTIQNNSKWKFEITCKALATLQKQNKTLKTWNFLQHKTLLLFLLKMRKNLIYTKYSKYSRLLFLFAKCLTGCNDNYGLPFWTLIAEKAISILWRTRFRCDSISLLCLIEIVVPPHKISIFFLYLAVDSADISREFTLKY